VKSARPSVATGHLAGEIGARQRCKAAEIYGEGRLLAKREDFWRRQMRRKQTLKRCIRHAYHSTMGDRLGGLFTEQLGGGKKEERRKKLLVSIGGRKQYLSVKNDERRMMRMTPLKHSLSRRLSWLDLLSHSLLHHYYYPFSAKKGEDLAPKWGKIVMHNTLVTLRR